MYKYPSLHLLIVDKNDIKAYKEQYLDNLRTSPSGPPISRIFKEVLKVCDAFFVIECMLSSPGDTWSQQAVNRIVERIEQAHGSAEPARLLKEVREMIGCKKGVMVLDISGWDPVRVGMQFQ